MSRGWFSESGKLLAVLNMPTDALFTSNIPLTFDKEAEALSLEIRRRVGASWRIRTSDPQLRRLLLYPAELRTPYICLPEKPIFHPR